jgi:hypothetical protein
MLLLFHKLFNPHCPHCKEEREEAGRNLTVEVLQLEIARLREENKRLLDRILEKPEEPKPVQEVDLQPIRSKTLPWNVKRQMLEAEDRRQAQILRAQKDEVNRLEKEMGVNDAVGSSDAQVETRPAS